MPSNAGGGWWDAVFIGGAALAVTGGVRQQIQFPCLQKPLVLYTLLGSFSINVCRQVDRRGARVGSGSDVVVDPHDSIVRRGPALSGRSAANFFFVFCARHHRPRSRAWPRCSENVTLAAIFLWIGLLAWRACSSRADCSIATFWLSAGTLLTKLGPAELARPMIFLAWWVDATLC